MSKIHPVGIWFWGTITGGKLQAGSDAANVQFFSIDDLPAEMAFLTDRLICAKLNRCLATADVAAWLKSCLAHP